MENAVDFLTGLYELEQTADNSGVVYRYVTVYITKLKAERDLHTLNDLLGNVKWKMLRPYTCSAILRNCNAMRRNIPIWGMALRTAQVALTEVLGPVEANQILRGLTFD